MRLGRADRCTKRAGYTGTQTRVASLSALLCGAGMRRAPSCPFVVKISCQNHAPKIMAAMVVCSLSPASSMSFAIAGEKSPQGGRRELSFGHGRWRRRSGMHTWACESEEDDERKEVFSNPLDFAGEFRKASESDESKGCDGESDRLEFLLVMSILLDRRC